MTDTSKPHPTTGAVKSNDQIGFRDLCRVILFEWPARTGRSGPELQAYELKHLELLNKEFRTTWSDVERDFPSDKGLSVIASSMPQKLAQICGPMDNYMEYSPVRGELDVIKQHLGDLKNKEDTLKESWLEMFAALLHLRWPKAVNLTSSYDRLRELGLSDRPYFELDDW